MHDSGKREKQSTGAQCDPSHMDAAMELLSPYSLWDLATWLGTGAKKYAPRNWEKGIPFSICVGKLLRHLAQFEQGKTDEDHLNAIGFWWHALAHYRAMIKLNLLPASLDDLPKYEQQSGANSTSPGYGDKKILSPKLAALAAAYKAGSQTFKDYTTSTLMQLCTCGGVKPIEDNEPEEFEGFTIVRSCNDREWFIRLADTKYYMPRYLYKNLELRKWVGIGGAYGQSYYKTKAEARDTIKAYKDKPTWTVEIYHPYWHVIGAWSVWDKVSDKYLHKSFQLCDETGYNKVEHDGLLINAPGYYPTKEIAEAYLKAYKEKQL